MTYVVGIRKFGVSAIICDTRVTFYRSNRKTGGSNISLKSGLLFPGCIYAIAGDLGSARSFIKECKQILRRTDTLPELWKHFRTLADLYKHRPDKKEEFQLLLSTRHTGDPEFWMFNSKQGSLKPEGGLVTLGSGQDILDESLHKFVKEDNRKIEDFLNSSGAPPFTFAYFYCLWLNEMVLGMELSMLEDHGVGGIFHFIYQHSGGEYPQQPAVYVLSAFDDQKRAAYAWIYRVVRTEDALVVGAPSSGARQRLIESAAKPSLESEWYLDRESLLRKIDAVADSEPFYYFCGFGFPYPEHRTEFLAHITTEGDYTVGKDGTLSPKARAQVEDIHREYLKNLKGRNRQK